jgi:hypothetical protein
MKQAAFDQLSYARRIRNAGRPIHIPADDGETRCIPAEDYVSAKRAGSSKAPRSTGAPALGSKFISSSLQRYRDSPYLVSSWNCHGRRVISNGSRILS